MPLATRLGVSAPRQARVAGRPTACGHVYSLHIGVVPSIENLTPAHVSITGLAHHGSATRNAAPASAQSLHHAQARHGETVVHVIPAAARQFPWPAIRPFEGPSTSSMFHRPLQAQRSLDTFEVGTSRHSVLASRLELWVHQRTKSTRDAHSCDCRGSRYLEGRL